MARVGKVEQSGGGDTKVVDGTYLLKLTSVEDKGISEMYPNSGPQWLWKWEVVRSLEAEPDEEQEAATGEIIHDYTADWIGYRKNGQKSNALLRIDALMNVDTPKPDGDDEIYPPVEDTDELIGRHIKSAITVAPNTKGNLRAKLATVAPYVPKRRAADPPPPGVITPRQLKHLQELAGKAGYDATRLDERSIDTFGVSPHQLGREDAAAFIEELQAEQATFEQVQNRPRRAAVPAGAAPDFDDDDPFD